MEFTGERYVPSVTGEIRLEHLHRYAFSLPYCSGSNVLDLACGEGYGTSMLATVARSVVGVDVCEAAVKSAAETYLGERRNLEYRVADVTQLPFPDATFDVVVSFETIEHVTEQERMLDEIARVLTPTGLLILSSPDKRTYSDESGIRNEFHVRELYLHELENLVARRFRRFSFMGQRLAGGSAIAPMADSHSTQIARASVLVDEGDRPVVGMPRLGDPLYVVVLATNARRLPTLRPSILLSKCDDPLQELKRVAKWASGVHAEMESLRSRYDNEKEEAGRLLEQANSRLGRVESELHQRDVLESLSCAASRERIASLEGELLASRAAVAHDVGRSGALGKELESAHAHLGEADARQATLESDIARLREAVGRLESERESALACLADANGLHERALAAGAVEVEGWRSRVQELERERSEEHTRFDVLMESQDALVADHRARLMESLVENDALRRTLDEARVELAAERSARSAAVEVHRQAITAEVDSAARAIRQRDERLQELESRLDEARRIIDEARAHATKEQLESEERFERLQRESRHFTDMLLDSQHRCAAESARAEALQTDLEMLRIRMASAEAGSRALEARMVAALEAVGAGPVGFAGQETGATARLGDANGGLVEGMELLGRLLLEARDASRMSAVAFAEAERTWAARIESAEARVTEMQQTLVREDQRHRAELDALRARLERETQAVLREMRSHAERDSALQAARWSEERSASARRQGALVDELCRSKDAASRERIGFARRQTLREAEERAVREDMRAAHSDRVGFLQRAAAQRLDVYRALLRSVQDQCGQLHRTLEAERAESKTSLKNALAIVRQGTGLLEEALSRRVAASDAALRRAIDTATAATRALACEVETDRLRWDVLRGAGRTIEPGMRSILSSLRNRLHVSGTPATAGEPSPVSACDAFLLLPDPEFVKWAYRSILRREADAEGERSYLDQLSRGLPRLTMIAALHGSAEGGGCALQDPVLRELLACVPNSRVGLLRGNRKARAKAVLLDHSGSPKPAQGIEAESDGSVDSNAPLVPTDPGEEMLMAALRIGMVRTEGAAFDVLQVARKLDGSDAGAHWIDLCHELVLGRSATPREKEQANSEVRAPSQRAGLLESLIDRKAGESAVLRRSPDSGSNDPSGPDPVWSIPVSEHPDISIVVPTTDEIDQVVATLRSIATNPPSTRFDVIVVGDPHADTARILQAIGGVRLVACAREAGVAQRVELGVAASNADYVHLLGPTALLSQGASEALRERLDADCSIGLGVSVARNDPSGERDRQAALKTAQSVMLPRYLAPAFSGIAGSSVAFADLACALATNLGSRGYRVEICPGSVIEAEVEWPPSTGDTRTSSVEDPAARPELVIVVDESPSGVETPYDGALLRLVNRVSERNIGVTVLVRATSSRTGAEGVHDTGLLGIPGVGCRRISCDEDITAHLMSGPSRQTYVLLDSCQTSPLVVDRIRACAPDARVVLGVRLVDRVLADDVEADRTGLRTDADVHPEGWLGTRPDCVLAGDRSAEALWTARAGGMVFRWDESTTPLGDAPDARRPMRLGLVIDSTDHDSVRAFDAFFTAVWPELVAAHPDVQLEILALSIPGEAATDVSIRRTSGATFVGPEAVRGWLLCFVPIGASTSVAKAIDTARRRGVRTVMSPAARREDDAGQFRVAAAECVASAIDAIVDARRATDSSESQSLGARDVSRVAVPDGRYPAAVVLGFESVDVGVADAPVAFDPVDGARSAIERAPAQCLNESE
jgi:SAM-dependent methyltransferase